MNRNLFLSMETVWSLGPLPLERHVAKSVTLVADPWQTLSTRDAGSYSCEGTFAW